MVDVLQEILDLLSNNWNSSNTSSKTPSFIKVTDEKRTIYANANGHVIGQRYQPKISHGGIGGSPFWDKGQAKLDVRVLGSGEEDYFLEVIKEIERIIAANQINPFSGARTITYAGDQQDMSNKTHHLWRTLIPITIYNDNH